MTQTPSRALLALLIAAGVALAAPAHAAPAAAAAASAASAPPMVVRAETAPLLRAAQDLQLNRDWVGLLAKLKQVEAVGNLNPYEQYLVSHGRAIAAYYMKDPATAAVEFRKTLDSVYMPAADRTTFLEILFQIQYDDLKQYQAALKTLDEYRQAGGNKPELLDAGPQVLYTMGDNKGAAEGFQKQVDAAIAAGKKPPERLLRMLVGAQQSLDDDAAIGRTAEILALDYPKPDVWSDVIRRAVDVARADPKLRLDGLRLHETILGYGPKEGGLLLTQAILAERGGYPAEARRLFEQAFSGNLVDPRSMADAKKVQATTQRSYAQEKASDKATEAAARKAKDGDALAGYGLEVFLDGQADRGLSIMKEALAKPQLSNAAVNKLHYGMALVRTGHLDEARDVLAPLEGKDGVGALAHAYLLWVKAGGAMMGAAKPAAAPAAAPAASAASQPAA